MTHLKNVSGYLPDENPPLGKLILFALQQIVVMFPATVIVALLTGFHISTTLILSKVLLFKCHTSHYLKSVGLHCLR